MKPTSHEPLNRYLKSGRIHPCLLFVGPDSSSKWQTAIQVAKTIFCESKKEGIFCGKCSSCLRIDKEIYPDLLLFKESDEEALNVEKVRDVIYQMEVSPLEGKAKVCIIEEAHRMNQASSNAFLKTLEEPKENRYFILLTSKPGAILPTIHSRAISFHFKPAKESIEFSEEDRGSFQKAMTQFFSSKEVKPLLELSNEKQDALRLLQFLESELRVQATSPTQTNLFSKLSPKDCALKYEKLVELEGKLRSNANHGLLLESLLLKEFQI
jgi:DNA polymerase III gamma/tau subunit